MRSNLKALSLMFLLLASVAACSKQASESGGGSQLSGVERSRSLIPLTAVQGDSACLNVPLYTMALRQLRPDLPLLQVTTDFSLHSAVRENFRLLSAFGNFKFEQLSGTDSIDLQGWKQTGCKTLIRESADGTEEEFRITESTPEFLLAESDSGARISFRWISETRVEVGSRHKVLDLPCSAATSLADVQQTFDWSGQLPPALDKASGVYVDEKYLESLATAVGTSSADYYQTSPENPEVRLQITAKLMELARATVRPELVTCNGAAPPPAPQPEDPSDPIGPTPPDPEDPLPPIEPPPADPEDPEDPEEPRPVFPGPLAVEADWL